MIENIDGQGNNTLEDQSFYKDTVKSVLAATNTPEHIDLTQYNTTKNFFADITKITENMKAISDTLKRALGPVPSDPTYKRQSFGDVFGNTRMHVMHLAWEWKFSEAADIYGKIYALIDIFPKFSEEEKWVVHDILQQVFIAKHNQTIDVLTWVGPITFFFKTLHEKLPQYFT